MKLFSQKHIVVCIITFIILFAMNYIGNDLPDRLERALMIAIASVIGLNIGIFILYKPKNDQPHDDFE